MAGNKEKLFPEKNFNWPENKVKFLGVWLSIDPSITLNMNYKEKMDKIITTNLYLSTAGDESPKLLKK